MTLYLMCFISYTYAILPTCWHEVQLSTTRRFEACDYMSADVFNDDTEYDMLVELQEIYQHSEAVVLSTEPVGCI